MRLRPDPRIAAPLAGAVIALALAGCSGGSQVAARDDTGDRITVFAAASLTDAFDAEAAAYEQKTGGHVRLSYAGSQDLVAQIDNGAPADVVATADTETLGHLTVARMGTPAVFARNRLVVVAAPGNPKHLNTLDDLARPGLVVVLAGPSVPVGKYAAQLLAAGHVVVHPKSLEDNVRGVLTKVELGEADAGIVYLTDARSAGSKVATVQLPESPIATYPILPLRAAGTGFVAFVLSPIGQDILARRGFLPPA